MAEGRIEPICLHRAKFSRRIRILGHVKTRTLLLLAVTCGLNILVAGGIKLFLIADDPQPDHLTVGQIATVGEMRVAVTSVERSGGQTLVSVELIGVDDADGAVSWVFGTGKTQLNAVKPSPGDGKECGATTASSTTDCVLAFDTTDVGVLRYQRANESLRWDIVAQTG